MRNSALAFDIAQARYDRMLPSDPMEQPDIREILSDSVQLRELDQLGRLSDQIEGLILAWDEQWQPGLPGHDEITPRIAQEGVRMAEAGDGGKHGLVAYYALAAAIAEVWERTRPQVYMDLYNAAEILVEGA